MWILAQLLTELTGKPRQKVVAGVDFEWSKGSWVHNAFRVYELIFWRRYGIRCELSAGRDKDGQTWQHPHTFEAAIGIFEGMVRAFFARRLPKFQIVRVPAFATPQGVLFPSFYSFAIAFDASGGNLSGPLTTATWTHVCTGSNLAIFSGGRLDNAVTTAYVATYNSVSLTQIGTTQNQTGISQGIAGLLAPSTGSNTMSTSFNSSTGHGVYGQSVSYSGVKQSGLPDSTNQNKGTAAQTLTGSTTVVASNCWTAIFAMNDQQNNSAGTGSTARGTTSSLQWFDSNGTVGTGSQSMTVNFTGINANFLWTMLSFAPAASSGTTKPHLLMMMGVGN